jgi:Zn-dependent protease with chaperone function
MIDAASIEVQSLLRWVLTYLIHSTIVLTAVWMICAWSRRLSDVAAEHLWRCGLCAPLLTATLQVALGVAPLLGGLSISQASSIESVLAVEPEIRVPMAIETPGTSPDDAELAVEATVVTKGQTEDASGAIERHDEPVNVVRSSPSSNVVSATTSPSMQRSVEAGNPADAAAILLAAVALLAAGCGIGGALVDQWRLRRALRGRQPIADARLLDLFEQLHRRAGCRRRIHLTNSAHLMAPIAFGMTRPEICLPTTALERLSAERLRAVLAHELAHHVRWDPAWLVLASFVRRVLFFQPLNRVVSRNLRELAEYRCDAWAAERTGDGLALAASLAEVASWFGEWRERWTPPGVAAMADRSSPLRRRIDRLVDGSAPPDPPGARWHRTATTVSVVAMLTLAAPGITSHAIPDGPSDPAARSEVHAADPREALDAELDALASELHALAASLDSLRASGAWAERQPHTADLLHRIDVRRSLLTEHHERLEKQRRADSAHPTAADAPPTFYEFRLEHAKE